MNNRQEERQDRTLIQEISASKYSPEERNAFYIIAALIVGAIPSIALFLYYGLSTNSWQVLAVAAIIFVVSIIAFFTTFLIRDGKYVEAMTIVVINISVTLIAVPLLVEGLGIVSGLSAAIFIVAISSLAMPSRFVVPGLFMGIAVGLVIFFLDVSLQYSRLNIPQLQQSTPYISASLLVFFIILGASQFNRYSLRAKVSLGILVTGSLIIAALAFFGTARAQQLINLLTRQYEDESRARINEEIVSLVSSEAETADDFFDSILNDLVLLANVRVDLEKQKTLLSQGTYWDAITRVFQLPGGQFDNASTDISAIFIPSTVTIDQDLIADLNTSAYLDFYAPAFLNAHPEVVSVYYINKAGASTFYPNTNLAGKVQHDFDPRREEFYTIVDPQNNPSREPKWTDVYMDPAGNGLVVTLSIPIYKNDVLQGVMSADIQLASISERISNIKPGVSGYAFLIDSKGHILAMPDQGYQIYAIQPEILDGSDSPSQSILTNVPFDLQKATTRIINGETGVETIQGPNNENSLIAFAPLETPNYRMAVVAPEFEFTAGIAEVKSRTAREVEKITNNSVLILVLLFIAALLISLWIGQLITTPLIRLTQTVDTISAGDLTARASVGAGDETGRLAAAFNVMAERLSSTLSGLEQNVTERTRELELANKNNEHRALQFESITRIAQIIGSTDFSEDLLPRVAEVISQQFNLYHVGIFLLDIRKEYAVLTASNSEGGRKMIARNHRVPVNETSIVGYTGKSGQPRLALDTDEDSMYSTNPDLSRTRSELSLPLMVGSDIIGVLDVQSTEKNAFSPEDINVMSTLARQVSIAIQNARAYQQTREALKRAEIASMELSRQNWKQFTGQQSIEGVLFDGVNTKKVSRTEGQTEHNLAIPLVLRGTKIGSIKLNSIDPMRVWTEDEIAVLQAAAERTTLAIENARLLQEAQKRAAKERTIGEISSKISGLVNIENILETAIKELGTTLTNTDISIQFNQEDSGQNA
jgi:GAF domain-containing protein/HAMP domain-containing protein